MTNGEARLHATGRNNHYQHFKNTFESKHKGSSSIHSPVPSEKLL